MKIDAPYNEVVEFHGHSCPGLAIGYRVAQSAIDALKIDRSKDEEFVAIVENDACGVDAIQYILGCTFGKGNLIFHDYGKHAYTIIRRDNGKAVRILADFPRSNDDDQQQITLLMEKAKAGNATEDELQKLKEYKTNKTNTILDEPSENLLKIEFVDVKIPSKAKIADSIKCSNCGEKVMATKLKKIEDKRYCIPCILKIS